MKKMKKSLAFPQIPVVQWQRTHGPPVLIREAGAKIFEKTQNCARFLLAFHYNGSVVRFPKELLVEVSS